MIRPFYAGILLPAAYGPSFTPAGKAASAMGPMGFGM